MSDLSQLVRQLAPLKAENNDLRELNERLKLRNTNLIGTIMQGRDLARRDMEKMDKRFHDPLWVEYVKLCDKRITEALQTP